MPQKKPVVEMKELDSSLMWAIEDIETIPDDKEWSAEELAELEEVRDKSLRLAREIESIFDALNGRGS